jgi:GDP-mannose 6-dehydrogenase
MKADSNGGAVNFPQVTTKPYRISIFGLGYVGSVMAACLARLGHCVIGVDINRIKVESFNQGRCLICEPNLEPIIAEEHRAGRLRATSDAAEAVHNSDLSFVCVGTPSLRAGRLDVSSVARVCEEIGSAFATKHAWHTIAIRSTVLPGTIERVVIPDLQRHSRKSVEQDFAVCANPEFIREGSAVQDFFQPPFTVIGAPEPSFLVPLRDLYGILPGAMFETSLRTAEMVKYACNTFHALKIVFANEIGSLSDELGVNADEVMNVLCGDTKLNISRTYLKPGFAFGGSCLPKDVGALAYCAQKMDLTLPLLQAILPGNRAHIDRALERIRCYGKQRIGFLGLSFKSGTADLRESAALHVVKRLIGEGCQVLIYDPGLCHSLLYGANRRFAEAEIPHILSLLRPNMDEVVHASEVIVIANRDEEYLRVAELVTVDQTIVDLVGIRCSAQQPPTSAEDQTPAPALVSQQYLRAA